jgi:hypothetical protein
VCFARLEFFLWGSDNQPENLVISIVEYLAQQLRTDQNAAVLWHVNVSPSKRIQRPAEQNKTPQF